MDSKYTPEQIAQAVALNEARELREMEAAYERVQAATEDGAGVTLMDQESLISYVQHLRDELATHAAAVRAVAFEEFTEVWASGEGMKLHDAEIRRDQAEKDAVLVENHWAPDTAEGEEIATGSAELIRAQFTPSAEESTR